MPETNKDLRNANMAISHIEDVFVYQIDFFKSNKKDSNGIPYWEINMDIDLNEDEKEYVRQNYLNADWKEVIITNPINGKYYIRFYK